MCSEFTIKADYLKLEKLVRADIENLTGEESWEARIKLSTAAPLLEMKQDRLQLVKAIFPVQPFPNSRLSGSEGGTDEDLQIKRIYERPTWKKGFEEERCLVPMSSFYEPAYWGPHKGAMMEFTSEEDEILWAAGIKIKARVPSTAKATAFSLLTHTPSAQMLNYHHRLLVFLKAPQAL